MRPVPSRPAFRALLRGGLALALLAVLAPRGFT